MTGRNSTSLLRKPGAKQDFVRGRSGQFPFSPGGLEGVSEGMDENARYRINEKTQLGPLLSIPPGFTRGMRMKSMDEDVDLETADVEDEDGLGEVVRSIHITAEAQKSEPPPIMGFEGIDDLLPEEVPNTVIDVLR